MGMEYFGDKIKELRVQRHWSQDSLANRLRLTRSTISLYESNATYPSIDVLIKLCEIFGVSSDYLLGLTNDKETTLSTSSLTDTQLELCRNMVEEFKKSNSLNQK